MCLTLPVHTISSLCIIYTSNLLFSKVETKNIIKSKWNDMLLKEYSNVFLTKTGKRYKIMLTQSLTCTMYGNIERLSLTKCLKRMNTINNWRLHLWFRLERVWTVLNGQVGNSERLLIEYLREGSGFTAELPRKGEGRVALLWTCLNKKT